MSENNNLEFETLAIHAGIDEPIPHQALDYPLFMSSTFTFTDIEQAEDTFDFKRKAYVYSRGGNPTVNLFERRMAHLENGSAAVGFASGIAAITTTLLSLVKQGDTILAHHTLYGSTRSSLAVLFKRMGINTKFVDLTQTDQFENYFDETIKTVFFETPTNPALGIIDIEKLSAVAKKHNAKVVTDNTFATPYLQQPLNLGADIVVHSASKFLSGHGDVIAGVAISKDEDYINSLKFEYLCELGGVLSPYNAWLILRGMKTLSLRIEHHQKNALHVLKILQEIPEIETIMHPSLTEHRGHNIAKKQMRGFGSVISFNLKGDFETAKKFVAHLKLIKLAVSLGDVETLIQIPSVMTHRSYDFNLKNLYFKRKTIRLSVGLENPIDIINDIKQAIKATYTTASTKELVNA
jgi:methionine-gamma-lyase